MVLWFLVLLLFSTLSTNASYEFGQQGTPHDAKAHLPFEIKNSNVVVDPEIQEVVSKSGIKAWLVERKDLDVVSFSVMIADAGSKADPSNKQGLVRLFLAMTDEGAGPYTAEQFKRFLLENNILFNADFNEDSVIFNIRFPKTSTDAAFKALNLILTDLRLTTSDLSKVKAHLFTNYNQSTQNEGIVSKEFMNEKLFGNHPYAQKISSYIAHLSHITSDDIRTYISERFTQDKLVIGVCGNMSKELLQQKIEEAFASLPKTSTAKLCSDIVLNDPGPLCEKSLPIPQSIILFTHPGIKRNDSRFYPIDLAIHILGSGDFGSRLMQSVREEKGLVYGIGIGLDISKHAQLIIGSASTRHKTVPEVINLIRSEWKKFVEKGVTQTELDNAKMRLLGMFPLRFGNTTAIASILLAIQYHNLGIDFLKKRTALIQRVTLDEINKVIQEFFAQDHLNFFVVGQENPPTNDLDPQKNGITA